jgi:hypothetical protein
MRLVHAFYDISESLCFVFLLTSDSISDATGYLHRRLQAPCPSSSPSSIYGRNCHPDRLGTFSFLTLELCCRVNDAVMLYACADLLCESMTSLGCAGCATVSTSCASQQSISGSFVFFQECFTFSPSGLYWDSCDGRPGYALTNRDQRYYLYYYAPMRSWFISDDLGAKVPSAWVLSDALDFSGIDSRVAGVEWYVFCNGQFATAPGLLALSYMDTATFTTATSLSGIMKVQFVSSSCVTNPDWRDANDWSCEDYVEEGLCDNGYGPLWNPEWGIFEDWADADGADASLACCECRGNRTAEGLFGRFASNAWLANQTDTTDVLDLSSYMWTDWCRNASYVTSYASADNISAPEACCECKSDSRYEYACPTGYVRHEDTSGVYCQEVNECALGVCPFLDFSHSCGGQQACINTAGSFHCYDFTTPEPTCLRCAAGQYSSNIDGRFACSDCPVFSHSPGGSDESTDCKCNSGYSGPDGEVSPVRLSTELLCCCRAA